MLRVAQCGDESQADCLKQYKQSSVLLILLWWCHPFYTTVNLNFLGVPSVFISPGLLSWSS